MQVQCEGYLVALVHNILKAIRHVAGPCAGAIFSATGTSGTPVNDRAIPRPSVT